MSFLNAEWRKLVIANYVVNPKILEKYLPCGTILDLWEDKCYVSLVGFMFLNTKLLGIKIPFHTNFEEVNLRFYVKRIEKGIQKRGVVFIKEIVPKAALTFVANTIYKEHYETLTMKHTWLENKSRIEVEYLWKKAEKWNSIKVGARNKLYELATGSEAEFITEHYWGYARIDQNRTIEYEVKHPKWEAYNIDNYEINVDFAAVYGDVFGFLTHETPFSVMLAEGSEISVESKRRVDN
jgi:uncharacterized protein